MISGSGISPDARRREPVQATRKGAFGYCHSYETSSATTGRACASVLFVSGCLLRCSYCHNPDTWHLKDGTYVSADHVLRPPRRFRSRAADRSAAA